MRKKIIKGKKFWQILYIRGEKIYFSPIHKVHGGRYHFEKKDGGGEKIIFWKIYTPWIGSDKLEMPSNIEKAKMFACCVPNCEDMFRDVLSIYLSMYLYLSISIYLNNPTLCFCCNCYNSMSVSTLKIFTVKVTISIVNFDKLLVIYIIYICISIWSFIVCIMYIYMLIVHYLCF